MNYVKKFTIFLEGKKTHLVALATAVDGLYQYYVQHNSNWQTLVAYLLVGGGLSALRAAITKVQ